MSEKYSEGDRFLEVTFQLSVSKRVFKNDSEIDVVVDDIIDKFPYADNIRVIPCEMRRSPARLVVNKDDSSYTVYNSKQESQMIEEGE